MVKHFLNYRALTPVLFNLLATAEVVYFFNREGSSSPFFIGFIAFSASHQLATLIPWHGLGLPLNVGIRDHFLKTYLIFTYLGNVILFLHLLGIPWIFLTPLIFIFVPFLGIDFMLIFHRFVNDKSQLPLNWFSFGYDQKEKATPPRTLLFPEKAELLEG